MEKKKILIIDDDPDIRDTIQVILEKNGFIAAVAASGKDGIEAVKKDKPDLVLCDMMMEEVDAGTKVAAAIKKSNPALPIFLLSSIGKAMTGNVEIEKMGFNGVFQKPVYPDQLLTTLKRALKVS